MANPSNMRQHSWQCLEARSEPVTPGPDHADAESDDFKPTTPGHSPVAGHSTPGGH
ncbi:hypothetical protein NC651_031054 [Populus alba x Populus x berolinensis]|nr:hypothetical protein NC651_031054 [Populus alba x Populus x berolinensis]